jgi:hypothetical protein
MSEPTGLQIPPGHVVVTTFGSITQQTAQCLMDARSASERAGLDNVAWRMVPSTLVEKARNDACRALLASDGQWLLFIDGDAHFAPDAVLGMLHTAYALAPTAGCVGAWMPLRGDMALPTIDTGTGTWESHFPGSGVLDVMRTGAAFLLVKREVLASLADPWFRVRVPARPLDFMLEVDNWARIKFDGRNPLRDAPGDAWAKLERCARDDPSSLPGTFVPGEVGEDSSFCDRARNAGFRIVVNTDIACGHVDARILTWQDHKKAVEDRDRAQRLLCGITA